MTLVLVKPAEPKQTTICPHCQEPKRLRAVIPYQREEDRGKPVQWRWTCGACGMQWSEER